MKPGPTRFLGVMTLGMAAVMGVTVSWAQPVAGPERVEIVDQVHCRTITTHRGQGVRTVCSIRRATTVAPVPTAAPVGPAPQVDAVRPLPAQPPPPNARHEQEHEAAPLPNNGALPRESAQPQNGVQGPTAAPPPAPTTARQSSVTAPGSPAPGSSNPKMSGAERKVVELLNAERANRGLGPLEADPQMSSVARAHSQDMCERHYFSHQSPEGAQPWDRLRSGHVGAFSAAAENIAVGYPTAAAVHAGWLASPGHRANRLDPRYTRVGVGLFTCPGHQLPYWTEVFTR